MLKQHWGLTVTLAVVLGIALVSNLVKLLDDYKLNDLRLYVRTNIYEEEELPYVKGDVDISLVEVTLAKNEHVIASDVSSGVLYYAVASSERDSNYNFANSYSIRSYGMEEGISLSVESDTEFAIPVLKANENYIAYVMRELSGSFNIYVHDLSSGDTRLVYKGEGWVPSKNIGLTDYHVVLYEEDSLVGIDVRSTQMTVMKTKDEYLPLDETFSTGGSSVVFPADISGDPGFAFFNLNKKKVYAYLTDYKVESSAIITDSAFWTVEEGNGLFRYRFEEDNVVVYNNHAILKDYHIEYDKYLVIHEEDDNLKYYTAYDLSNDEMIVSFSSNEEYFSGFNLYTDDSILLIEGESGIEVKIIEFIK